MGRSVQVRENYSDDVAALTRLANAVDKNPYHSASLKEQLRDKINEVIVLLIQAPRPGKKK